MSGAILLLASPTFSSLVLLLALEGDFDLPPPFDFFTLVGFLAFEEIGEGLLLARSFERAARPFFDLGARPGEAERAEDERRVVAMGIFSNVVAWDFILDFVDFSLSLRRLNSTQKFVDRQP